MILLNATDAIGILSKTYIFQDIGYPLLELSGKMSLCRYDKGENIFKEAEEGSCLFLLVSGKVLLYYNSTHGQTVSLQTIGPLDIFGEMSLLDGGQRYEGAKALENSVVFFLERKDFLKFLNNNPQEALKIIENLGKRIRLANVSINTLTEKNRMLLGQQIDLQKATKDEKVLDLEPGQQDEKKIELDLKDNDEASLSEKLEDYLDKIKETEKDEIQAAKKIDFNDMLYFKKYVCPMCEVKYESPKVLSKYIRVLKADNDFNKHYEYINPLYYEIMVCPQCGFASNEEIFSMSINDKHHKEIESRLLMFRKNQPIKNYSGVRTIEQVIETFMLTLFLLEGRLIKQSIKGLLYLKIAWLYRYKGDQVKEGKYIEKAIQHLVIAYEKEGFSDPGSELKIVYLLGVLNIRIGNNLEAARWLEQVLKHPAKNNSSIMLNQTRDLWMELRQKLRDKNTDQ